MSDLRISVWDSSELRATIAAAKASDREIRAEMRRQTKAVAADIWKRAILGRVQTRLDTRVLADTARVAVSDQNVMLKSAAIKGRKMSGGGTAPVLFAGLEFGAEANRRVTYESTSRRGRRYTLTRRIGSQFPDRTPRGRIVYPAAAEVIPRIAALWTQTVLRTFMETLERKAS